MQVTDYRPIGDYALIGDCQSAALVSREGSIDWWCPVRFDAPAAFCRLLDRHRGGYWHVRAADNGFRVERAYRGDTNVLETTWTMASGRARVTDLFVVQPRSSEPQGYDVSASQQILRMVEGLDGELDLNVEFKPTFDFARARSVLTVHGGGEAALATANGAYLVLACPGVTLQSDGERLWARLHVSKGDSRWLVLTYANDPDAAHEAFRPTACNEQLTRTLEYWNRWAKDCQYRGPYRAAVLRSALVLKLLTYERTGAVVAAPTTSLPEEIGGIRNWDYRYSWLRDASLVLYALMTIGFDSEAADFMHWLERTIGDDPGERPQIMYGIDGRRTLDEEVLDHLEGYRGSQPVRAGNAAYMQRQLDIHGEVMRAAALHYRHTPPAPRAWRVLRQLTEVAAAHWTENGSGIWEQRGRPQAFLYGKVMCWTALDTAIDLTRRYSLDGPVAQWESVAHAIREAVLAQGFNARVGAFTQSFGSRVVDASALVIPRVGLLAADDPRMQSTIDQVQRLLLRDGLVYRYRAADGLDGDEGAFTLCAFWLVDALSLQGRVAEARSLFESVLRRTNDLGLLGEEIDVRTGEQLGNFPQGFSHAALIGAAANLERASRRGPEPGAVREVELSQHAREES